MTSVYSPSILLKGTLNVLQFCVNQMSVLTPLLKLSILLGAHKKYQQPTENFGILCEDKNSKIFLLYHVNSGY